MNQCGLENIPSNYRAIPHQNLNVENSYSAVASLFLQYFKDAIHVIGSDSLGKTLE